MTSSEAACFECDGTRRTHLWLDVEWFVEQRVLSGRPVSHQDMNYLNGWVTRPCPYCKPDDYTHSYILWIG